MTLFTEFRLQIKCYLYCLTLFFRTDPLRIRPYLRVYCSSFHSIFFHSYGGPFRSPSIPHFFSFAWNAVPLNCLLQQAMDTGNLLSPESQQNNFVKAFFHREVLHAVVIWLLTCDRAHAQQYQPSCRSHGPRWLRCSSLCRFHLNNSYLREQIHITLYHSNMEDKHFNKASTKLKLAAFYMRWIQYETRKNNSSD